MKLIVYGNIGFDEINSLGDKVVVNGGAAYYSATGASIFSSSVGIVGAVGGDYDLGAIRLIGLGTDGISVYGSMSSARFLIRYGKDMRERNIDVRLGASELLTPKLIPNDYFTDVRYVHITPINPEKQLELIDFIRREHPEVKISIDMIKEHINDNTNMVKEVLQNVDLAFLDKEEAAILHEHGIVPRSDAIIKHGAAGAEYINGSSGERLSVPAPRVDHVIDKTGAGDLLAGALLAQISSGTQELEKALMRAVEYASEKVKGYGVGHLIKHINKY